MIQIFFRKQSDFFDEKQKLFIKSRYFRYQNKKVQFSLAVCGVFVHEKLETSSPQNGKLAKLKV